ncbi:MAG: response regulator [Phycisphaerales bacterium]|nr:response regulator [Phycisphaerales bacterium]
MMTEEIEHQEAPSVALSIISLDDDADFREYITGVLGSQGHRVRSVSSPAELTKECAAQRPDIILLDLNMGSISGEEVLAEIKENYPKQCVIVVTGYPSLESMRQTFKQDVFDYLTKPFSVDDLKRVIQQAATEFGLGLRPMDRLRSELGRQIRLARTQHGWTLRELSQTSGISVSQLSSIERGTHLPSIESLVSIASALDSTPSNWFASSGF